MLLSLRYALESSPAFHPKAAPLLLPVPLRHPQVLPFSPSLILHEATVKFSEIPSRKNSVVSCNTHRIAALFLLMKQNHFLYIQITLGAFFGHCNFEDPGHKRCCECRATASSQIKCCPRPWKDWHMPFYSRGKLPICSTGSITKYKTIGKEQGTPVQFLHANPSTKRFPVFRWPFDPTANLFSVCLALFMLHGFYYHRSLCFFILPSRKLASWSQIVINYTNIIILSFLLLLLLFLIFYYYFF